MSTESVIIGESERAGMPISAPIYKEYGVIGITIGTVRWLEKKHSFVLQQYREWWEGDQKFVGWADVFCTTKP